MTSRPVSHRHQPSHQERHYPGRNLVPVDKRHKVADHTREGNHESERRLESKGQHSSRRKHRHRHRHREDPHTDQEYHSSKHHDSDGRRHRHKHSHLSRRRRHRHDSERRHKRRYHSEDLRKMRELKRSRSVSPTPRRSRSRDSMPLRSPVSSKLKPEKSRRLQLEDCTPGRLRSVVFKMAVSTKRAHRHQRSSSSPDVRKSCSRRHRQGSDVEHKHRRRSHHHGHQKKHKHRDRSSRG